MKLIETEINIKWPPTIELVKLDLTDFVFEFTHPATISY